MAHIDHMLDRLPTLYRDGELVGGMLATPALALEIIEQDLMEIQRSHFFDTTLERSEAERLAAILAIAAEPWQSLGEYRAWVHALRTAWLQYGRVSVDAVTNFVAAYTNGFQRAGGFRASPVLKQDPESWIRVPPPLGAPPASDTRQPARRSIAEGRPLLLETPPIRRYQRTPADGGIEPLQQFSIQMRGLDATTASFLLTGLPGDPECTPAIINVTTGQALIYLDTLTVGRRLWIRATPEGDAVAELEAEDVTDRLRSVQGVLPGHPWSLDQVDPQPKALRLERGENLLWFLPIAHYDSPGLDRYLLALADLLLKQGRYDQTAFDFSLFYQSPAARLSTSWIETRPASFVVGIPAGAMISDGSGDESGEALASALENREQLASSLALGLEKLRAAGVDAALEMLPLADTQRMADRLVMALPIHLTEQGTTGVDRLRDAGGAFDMTGYEHSSFH